MLQETKNRNIKESSSLESNYKASWQKDLLLATFLAIAVFVLTLLWFSFDNHFPAQDEAEHIMNSMSFKDLLTHCHPWHYRWWRECFTLNGFYPPFIYFVNGCFLLIFGQSRFVEQLSIAFFTSLLTASIYGIARIIKASKYVACMAALILYAYPVISSLSHTFLLDLPAASMTALALMALLWWRNRPEPNWKYTVTTGFVVGCACLSKQLVAAYLLPLGIYFLFQDIIANLKPPDKKPISNWLLHTLLIGTITILMALPFLVLNHNCLAGMHQSFIEATTFKQINLSYLQRIWLYAQLLPQQMSPFLFILFLFSLLICPKRTHKQIIPITISALAGFAITCTSAWASLLTDQRYTAPSLITSAIYSAFFLEHLLFSIKPWQKIITSLIITVAIIDYTFFNFVPYPLFLPKLSWQTYISDHDGNPSITADWGQNLVINTIENLDKQNSVYLNILTNSPMLNVHTFQLLLKEKGNKTIIPTSSRIWTVIGDQIDFNPKTATYFQWYLLKNNSSGYYFHDQQSERNFKQLVDFVCKSGKYNLVMKKVLPDSSELMLYRRCY